MAFGMRMAEIDRADELKLSVKNGVFAGILYMLKVGFSLIGGGGRTVLIKNTGFTNILVLV